MMSLSNPSLRGCVSKSSGMVPSRRQPDYCSTQAHTTFSSRIGFSAGSISFRAARAMALAVLLSSSFVASAQWSENPSDATPSLLANTSDPLTPAISTACTNGTSNGAFSMSSVTSATPQTANLPYPPCAVQQSIPQNTPPKDIWFRLDKPFGDAVYRFTVLGTGSPAMVFGGMAIYEALSATAPMRLVACVTWGSATSTLPSAEATGLTPGHKLYVRVWDRTTPTPVTNSNFTICVMGQRVSTIPDRNADETPCAAREIFSTLFTTSTARIVNYVYATEEASFLLATDEIVAGDLWVKLLIPPVGHVRLKASFGTTAGNQIGNGSPVADNAGVSAYLSPNCADPLQFRQVASTTSLVTPLAVGQPLDIRCLPAGEWLYVRIHSLVDPNPKVKRFGQLRLEWNEGPLPYPGWVPADRPASTQPCSAIPLTVGATCTGSTAGSTNGSCSVTGIPEPLCGGFGPTKGSVWYRFTAPNSGLVVLDAKAGSAPATQPAMALYTNNVDASDPTAGCNLRMSLVDCDDRQGVGTDARIIRGSLIPGQVYFVRVWSRGTSSEGNFTLCVSSPPPPAGTCWYLIDLWAVNSPGKLGMRVSITPGDTITYNTSGNDPSELFMVPVPIGGSAYFGIIPLPAAGYSTGGGYYSFGVWQAGSSDPLWFDDGGYPVTGPTPPPVYSAVLNNACSPIVHPRTDCFGMRTICLDNPLGPTYTVTGQMDTRYKPDTQGGAAYGGTTLHPQTGGMIDLGGTNMGCLSGEQGGIQWLVFHPEQDGTVAFLLDGTQVLPAPSTIPDLDFAIWDLGMLAYQPVSPDINGYDVCPPKTPPVRCSSARALGTTGLAAGMFAENEGHGGFGWLKPLPVLQGHGYAVAIVTNGVPGRINYNIKWTMYENAAGVPEPSIIGCEPLVLPIELLFLQGLARKGEVDLEWATASEMNSAYFVVERSANSMDFISLGRVSAAGNSQKRIDYAYTDTDPMGGVNYYRLRMVDLDGSSEVSNTIAVMFTGDGTRMLVYPNPVHDRMNLSMDILGETEVTLHVLDALGRLVMQRRIAVDTGRNELAVDTGILRAGAYFVRVLDASGSELGTARFAKD